MNGLTLQHDAQLPTGTVGTGAVRGGQGGSTPSLAGMCRAFLAFLTTKLMPVTVYAGPVGASWRPERSVHVTPIHAVNPTDRRVFRPISG